MNLGFPHPTSHMLLFHLNMTRKDWALVSLSAKGAVAVTLFAIEKLIYVKKGNFIVRGCQGKRGNPGKLPIIPILVLINCEISRFSYSSKIF